MVRTILTLVCGLAVLGMAAPAQAGGCKGCQRVAKAGDGFCCGKGKAFGVELTSRKLYDAIAGKTVDTDKMKCHGCKKAAKTNGTCSHCKVGVADGKLYHSLIAHKIAVGTPYAAEKAAKCSSCKSAHEHNGFCTGCNAGFVAGRLFKTKETYDAALAAHTTIVKAAKASSHCEACAVAMVTDGSCAHCNVSFKDGKKTG